MNNNVIDGWLQYKKGMDLASGNYLTLCIPGCNVQNFIDGKYSPDPSEVSYHFFDGNIFWYAREWEDATITFCMPFPTKVIVMGKVK